MKTVLYICSDRTDKVFSQIHRLLEHELQVKIQLACSMRDAFPILTDCTDPVSVTLIDTDFLYRDGVDKAFDIVSTISTLMKYSECENASIVKSLTPIAFGVHDTTPLHIIRSIMKLDDTLGIYPAGLGFSIDEKQAAVEDILNGVAHIPKRVRAMVTSKRQTVAVQPKGDMHLTPRQQQIYDLVVTRGASNKAIAKILSITDSTVKLHMTSILKKCGVRTRTQLAVFTKETADI